MRFIVRGPPVLYIDSSSFLHSDMHISVVWLNGLDCVRVYVRNLMHEVDNLINVFWTQRLFSTPLDRPRNVLFLLFFLAMGIRLVAGRSATHGRPQFWDLLIFDLLFKPPDIIRHSNPALIINWVRHNGASDVLMAIGSAKGNILIGLLLLLPH